MEKHSENLDTLDSRKDSFENIESQVNYNENYSTLLFSRLLNPNIRNQLLTVLEENEKWLAEKSKIPYITENIQDPATGKFFYDEEGNFETREVLVTDEEYVAKTREQLELELDEGLVTQMASTDIDFDLLLDQSKAMTRKYNPDVEIGEPAVSAAAPQERVSIVGVKRDERTPLSQQEIQNYSATEAHEKGHTLRVMKNSEYLKNLFSPAFNIDAVDMDSLVEQMKKNVDEEVTEEQLKQSKNAFLEGYLFNFSEPNEIYERMSQLKGYFSMSGDEEFTKEHLDYARKNYLHDGLLDNNMTEFFQAITPGTEAHFLKIINSVGV